jgi:aminoglycoside 3-N-acetyltransferase
MSNPIRALVESMGAGPVFVHSDPFRAARLVKPVRDRNAFLDSHIALLRETTEGRALWLPAFNYDFGRTGVFDVRDSESQLGPIPERFRVAHAEWRTPIPIFSIAGIGQDPQPRWGVETDPFGDGSIFASLVREDGVILYYGDTFHYNTLVHYSERAAGGPVYRYDKLFPGVVVMSDGSRVEGSLDYHVRPLGTGLDYDWPRLLEEALSAGVCRRLEGAPEILAASARALSELWVSDLRRDPYALLDEKTRGWAEPAIEKLGRRFVLSDFEGPEAQAMVTR